MASSETISDTYFHIKNFDNENVCGFMGKDQKENYQYVFGNKKGNAENTSKLSEIYATFYMNSYGLPLNPEEDNFEIDQLQYVSIENSLGFHFYLKSPLDKKLNILHENLVKNTEGYEPTKKNYEWTGISVNNEVSVLLYFTKNVKQGYKVYVSSQQINV